MSRAHSLWLAFLLVWSLSLVAYGAVAPWAIAAVAAALSVLYVLSLVLLPERLKLSRAAAVWLGAAAGLFVLQLLPLGPLLFRVTDGWRARHGVGAFWPGTADAWRTAMFLAQAASGALAALLVLRLRQAGLSSPAVVKGLLAVIGLEAAWGVLRVFLSLDWIPFYAGPRSAPDVASGTLVGRNNFGGLLAVGLVLAVGLAWSRFTFPPRRREDEGPTFGRRLEAGLLWAFLAALLAVGIVLARSRGAALAAAGGLLVLPFVHRGRASLAGAGAILAIGLVGFMVANPQGLFERFRVLDPFEITADSRWAMFTTTASASLRQPVLGFGFGAHPVAYHPFQPPSLPGQVHHAHNEYLNILFEGGFVSLSVVLAGFVLFVLKSWRRLQSIPSSDRLPYAAALAGVAVVAIHSMVDMDLRITSLVLVFGALLGLVGSLGRRGEERPLFAWAPPLVAAASLSFLALDPRPAMERGEEAAQRRVLGLSPYEFPAARNLALAALQRKDAPAADRWFESASDLWPAHPDLQEEAGLWFWSRGDLARSSVCFKRLFEQVPGEVEGVLRRIWDAAQPPARYEALLPKDPLCVAHLAAFLVRRGDWVRGMEVFERGCPLTPASIPGYDAMGDALSAVGQWGLEAVIRDRRLELLSHGAAYAASARAWLRLGSHDRALERSMNACRVDPVNPHRVALKAEVLAARGERAAAIEVWTQALSMAGADPSWRASRASLCVSMKMYGVAIDDYRALLRSRPSDRGLTFALAQAQAASGDAASARRTMDLFLASHPLDQDAHAYRKSLDGR